ncbi:unnamed protein product [Brassicogethes aeneus]|uniref:Amyloid protein-binding protein 2 n=1 Tax=Brassicogethes aeneus TaxID=1431903 RepID=A0A9P0FNV6_BRAAE|nr:unnamed protein product [Brassicogethes aeneus]
MSNVPRQLYDICIAVAVSDCVTVCKFYKKDFRGLPNNVLFDFYYKMFTEKRLCLLAVEFSELEVFTRMLAVKHKRPKLLKSFQFLIDHGSVVCEDLIGSYEKYTRGGADLHHVVDVGLRLGSFFNEGGWYNHSIKVLNVTEALCKKHKPDVYLLRKLLDCYHKKIYAEAIYCEFVSAEATFRSSQETVEDLKKLNALPNLASLYTNYSVYYTWRSEYDEGFRWAIEALKLLKNDLPTRVIIEILRQTAKTCVVKRRFNLAGLLVRQAVNMAQELYKIDQHPRYSDTLIDYGFYLLNSDSIHESVKIYKKALDIRKEVFERNNIHVALAHEDMAYALYVHEYSSGRFTSARDHSEKSIRIMDNILPRDHLMLSSVKRVKALILEEQALDEAHNPKLQDSFLKEAEQLHKTALELSLKAFGEKNVQTAKHYGNMGRLYQSMKRNKEAELMHLRAIAIKEELLGKEDYEVGLSIGHLASLYNYHMKRHQDAEKLYMRSIEINLNLFGESYSGLEYDYRGLINVYSTLCDVHSMNLYSQKMREWRDIRSKIKPVAEKEQTLPLGEIVDKFFSMY